MATSVQKPPPVPHPEDNRVGISFRLPRPLVEALDRYAEAQSVSRTAAAEHLLGWALERAGESPRAD